MPSLASGHRARIKEGWPVQASLHSNYGVSVGTYGAVSVIALASSNEPPLTWRPLMLVKLVSPVSPKLQVPNTPL